MGAMTVRFLISTEPSFMGLKRLGNDTCFSFCFSYLIISLRVFQENEFFPYTAKNKK